MKKLLTATAILVLGLTACSDSSKTESTTTTEKNVGDSITSSTREQEIKDSTKMLDKKLAEPMPDSMK